jgi:hypothetical protein
MAVIETIRFAKKGNPPGRNPSGIGLYMEKGTPRRNPLLRVETGAALMAVVLVSSLVIGLVLLALTNSTIGRFLTSTHRKQKEVLSCAEGDMEVVTRLLTADDLFESAQAAGTFSSTTTITNKRDVIWVDTGMSEGDPYVLDLAEELRHAGMSGDDVLVNPDMTIQNQSTPDCLTDIDVDFLGKRGSLVGSGGMSAVANETILYHDQTSGGSGGTACSDGIFYNITAVTRGRNEIRSKVQSSFYKCPS